ncbi:hypothetical protein [Catenulispora yoronensis]|uniref:hypothetical protein n=1 Tax=Catenulispora yoronensis TaxID=450799 RepID=UPI0031DD99DE
MIRISSLTLGALVLAGCSDSGTTGAPGTADATGHTGGSGLLNGAPKEPPQLSAWLVGTWTGWITFRTIRMTIELSPGKWRSTNAPDQEQRSSTYGMQPGHSVFGDWALSPDGGTIVVTSSDPNMNDELGNGASVSLSGLPARVDTPGSATPHSRTSDDRDNYSLDFDVSWDGTVLTATLKGRKCMEMRRA